MVDLIINLGESLEYNQLRIYKILEEKPTKITNLDYIKDQNVTILEKLSKVSISTLSKEIKELKEELLQIKTIKEKLEKITQNNQVIVKTTAWKFW